jgi:hypothetical protein
MPCLERLGELGETAAEQAVEYYTDVEARFLCGRISDSAQAWWAVELHTGTREKTYRYILHSPLFQAKDTFLVNWFRITIKGIIRAFLDARGTHDDPSSASVS